MDGGRGRGWGELRGVAGVGWGGERSGRAGGTGLVLLLGFRTLALLPQTQVIEAADCGWGAHLP